MGRIKKSKVQHAIRRRWAVIGVATPQQIIEGTLSPSDTQFALDATGDKRVTKIEHIQNATVSELKRRNLIGAALIAPKQVNNLLSLKENFTIYLEQTWKPYIDEFILMALSEKPFDTDELNELVPEGHPTF